MAHQEVADRPEWMDDEFLAKCVIISKKLPKECEIGIDDVNLTYVVPKGENYMSVIYRVNVDYHVISGAKTNGVKHDEVSTDCLIVKASHESEQLKMVAKEAQIFLKETDMYLNLMPKLIKTLDSAGIDSNIACRCLYSVEGDREVIVMEDLKPKGYVLANRLTGLDLAHTKLVFEKLAKMHAASMHYFSTHEVPELYLSPPFEPKNPDIFEKMKAQFEGSLHSKIANVFTLLKNNPKYGNHILEFFKKYDQSILEVAFRDFKRVPGNKFNGLVHGDCWVNNMMFRYNDDGSVQDVLLIDLQISYYSSIANDFMYFFFSSTNKEVRKHHFQEVQKYYIDVLTHYLKKIGYTGDVPTLEELDAELRRLMLLAVYIVTNFNSIILAEFKEEDKDRKKSKAFEFTDIMNMDLTSKTYNDILLLSIDLLDENGFFDKYNLPELTENSTN